MLKALLISVATMSLFASSCASNASTPTIPETLILSGDNIVDVMINGQAFKVAIDPDIGNARVLNSDTAKKLALKGSMIGGHHWVGPVRVNAESNVLNYEMGPFKNKKRTFWLRDGKASDLADGAISASAVPYKIVQFQLKSPSTNEKLFTLPLSKKSGNPVLNINGQSIPVRFDLKRTETLVAASTGILLSQIYGGGLSGETNSQIIRYGILRPTKRLTLAQPMEIGGLPLRELLVRISDFGDARAIKNVDEVDGDELVVSAESKKKPSHAISLGRGFLAQCSSLTFDYSMQQVKMSCAL
jgi:hypothetical protein